MGDFNNCESLVIRLIYLLGQPAIDWTQGQWPQLVSQRGLILFSGPTGSGKTIAMYELVKAYSAQKVVLTMEDPVKVFKPSFLQIQVNARTQMSYDNLIKTSLRHRQIF